MKKQDQTKQDRLLGLETPAYRKAYSDRTCWLMACLAEFAYIQFNPARIDADKISHYVKEYTTFDDEYKARKFIAFINSLDYDHKVGMADLGNKVNGLKLKLIDTFDKDDTQAILVGNEAFLALVFRGTESDSPEDIGTDIDAVLITCESGGKIHRGFNVAYGKVAALIERTLSEKDEDRPLFITGHSLGGALATIAAKKLNYKKIAACYTFGAPRVGTENWVAEMKTPVYRIVNAADCVTMLPPAGAVIKGLTWFIPTALGQWLLKRFGGYMHGGNMRYLTNCNKGSYADVQLLYSVSILRRLYGWVLKGLRRGCKTLGLGDILASLGWKRFLADHSMEVYRKKLEIIACRRNNIQ